MTVKILLSIIALALSVCASAKIDYADYKKLQDAYQISAPEAEKLSESGNPYAKLRSALDNIPYEREKYVSEIRELYEKRGLRLAGYYLSNFLKPSAKSCLKSSSLKAMITPLPPQSATCSSTI